MVHIAISADDAAVLQEVLEGKLLELSKEVWHTDHHEYRDLLHARAAALERVLAQTKTPAASSR
jgi:hypothetical protein